ncbi:MAG: hypothetical protein ACOCV2_13055 [Persicimonas sp.]
MVVFDDERLAVVSPPFVENQSRRAVEEEAYGVEYTVPLCEPPVEAYAKGDGESLEDEEEEANARIKRSVKKRVERIIQWQSKLEPGELVERRSTPHEDAKNADPLEPLGPPKLRYNWFCRTDCEKKRGRYRTFRKKMREKYTKVGRVWRKGKEAFCDCCGGSTHALAEDGGEGPSGWLFSHSVHRDKPGGAAASVELRKSFLPQALSEPAHDTALRRTSPDSFARGV